MTREIQSVQSHDETPTELDRLFRELSASLPEAFGLWPFATGPYAALRDGTVLRAARTDVTDTGPSFRVVVEVPGIPKEKLEIRVRGANVEIRGEQSESADTSKGEFVHRERRYAGYYRAVELPEPVVAAEAKAKVENGVLELELPKVTPTPSPDEVQIRVD